MGQKGFRGHCSKRCQKWCRYWIWIAYAATSRGHVVGCGLAMFSSRRKNKEGNKDTAGEQLHCTQAGLARWKPSCRQPITSPKCVAPKKGQQLVRLTLEEPAPTGTGQPASSVSLGRQPDGKHNGRRGTAPPSAPGKCNLFLRPLIRHQLGVRAWNWLERDKAPRIPLSDAQKDSMPDKLYFSIWAVSAGAVLTGNEGFGAGRGRPEAELPRVAATPNTGRYFVLPSPSLARHLQATPCPRVLCTQLQYPERCLRAFAFRRWAPRINSPGVTRILTALGNSLLAAGKAVPSANPLCVQSIGALRKCGVKAV